jgi:hypothetical protein
VLPVGAPVATISDTFPVAGCPVQVPFGPGANPQPCVRIQWLVPAARVMINSQPRCWPPTPGCAFPWRGVPAGPPIVTAPQPRVVAS